MDVMMPATQRCCRVLLRNVLLFEREEDGKQDLISYDRFFLLHMCVKSLL